MPRPVKRALILFFGWAFVVLGVLGIFLPILQGILFLLVGLILLSRESEWVQGHIERLREKYPKFAEKHDEAEAYAERLWERIVTLNGKRTPGNRRPDGQKSEDI
jgi:uncharacterized membrane protein YbaN (DUF454 family)